MATTISPIALRIGGTKERRAGFAPLASVGVLAGGEGENMYRVSLVPEKPTFILKHAEDYILYMLTDGKVRPFDADASGALTIALTISKNMQLAGGRSPYTLLKEVYDTFRTNYMTPSPSDDRDVFKNIDVDSELFREILSRYPTEQRLGTYIPMNPSGLSGILCVPSDKLEAFFRDTQYTEFASFKDIHIGSACQTLQGLERLEIPRPVSYDIYVNGNPTGNKLVHADDMYRSGLPSTRYVEYDMISFTLHEVLSAPGNQLKIGSAIVQLDAASGHIHCTIPKRDIMYKMVVDLVGGNDNDQAAIRNGFKSGKIRILLGSEDITDLKEIKYSEVSGKEFTLYPSATEKHLLSVKSSLEPNKRELRLKISIVRKTITPASQPKPARQPLQPQNNFTPEPAPPYDDERPTSFMGRLGMDWKSLILGLIIGLLLGIAGGWYIGSPKEQKGQTPTPTPTEDPALKGHEGEVESLVVDTPQEESSVEETITNADNASAAADHAIGQASERNNPPQTTGENSGTGKNGRSTSTPTTRTSARTDNPPATPTTEETDKAAATATLKAEILSLINGATPDDLVDGKTIKTIRSKWDNQPGLLTPTEMNKIENLCAKRTGIDRGRAKTFFETKKPFANWDALISAKIE